MIESPLFVKTYDLLLWFHNHTAHYSKLERFRLAKRIDDSVYRLYDSILMATLSDNKKGHLMMADFEVKKLNVLCRLARDTRNMTMNQYAFISEKLVEIGKLIHGWKSKVEKTA